MLLGIVGAPNKGKSTLFAALTEHNVAIADYPFTTIDPNMGIAYASRPCPELQLGTKCNPRNSLCIRGIRRVPLNLIDVAGLVAGAHHGKGMGNRFLNDLAAAEGLILVADISGTTDSNGNIGSGCDPAADVEMVLNEIAEWIAGIVSRHMRAIRASADAGDALSGALAGLGVSKEQIEHALRSIGATGSRADWDDERLHAFAYALLAEFKARIIAANKADKGYESTALERLKERFGSERVVSCSAAVEMELRKAVKLGAISYDPALSELGFSMLPGATAREAPAWIGSAASFIGHNHGTGVQLVLNRLVFDQMQRIVVYPVENERSYADGNGMVLPDAILMKRGSTALHLASAIHTDIAKSMLYAINAKTRMRVGKDYVLQDGDVIKIVSAARKP